MTKALLTSMINKTFIIIQYTFLNTFHSLRKESTGFESAARTA